VGLGYVGSVRITRRERSEAGRDAFRRAFAQYLGSLYTLVAELRELPGATESGWVSDALDRLKGESWTFVTTRRRAFAAFGSRPFELQDRFADAAAHLQVLGLPPVLEQAVTAANEYVEQLAEWRTTELKSQWPRVYAQLHEAAKSISDQ
jgi:hypothetical protein